MKKNLVHIVLFEKFIIDYYNSITLFIFADSSSPEIFIRIFTILFVKIMLKKLAGRSFDSPCHISFKSTFKHLHVSRSNAFRIAATTFRPEISVPIRAKSQPLTVVAVCSYHWHADEFRIRGSCFQVKVAARSTVRSFSHPPFLKIAESCLIKSCNSRSMKFSRGKEIKFPLTLYYTNV